MKEKTSSPASINGHYIRRLHQFVNALYNEEMKELGLSRVQVAVIKILRNQPGIDQKTLARIVEFDAATVGGVIDRLEKRGLIKRNPSPTDRRAKLLTLTNEGIKFSEEILLPIIETEKRLIKPLTASEKADFGRLLKKLVDWHSEQS